MSRNKQEDSGIPGGKQFWLDYQNGMAEMQKRNDAETAQLVADATAWFAAEREFHSSQSIQ